MTAIASPGRLGDELVAEATVTPLGAVGAVTDDRGRHPDRRTGSPDALVAPRRVADGLLTGSAGAVADHGTSRGLPARHGASAVDG